MKIRCVFLALLMGITGCVPTYRLVPAGKVEVAHHSFSVQPTAAWNLVPQRVDQTQWEEIWTKNGPLLDTVTFVGGFPEGESLVIQRKKDDRQVPSFRSDMTPQDLLSMLEALYRVSGVTVFDIESIDPTDFLGGIGFQARYTYAPNDGISKKGICVGRVIEKKLYLLRLDGVSSHYFDAATAEFGGLVTSAALRN